MSYSQYDGLSIEAAIEKLRAKSFHDEEDKAFARARRSYFSPEELAAITGDDVVPAEGDESSPDAPTTPDEPTVPTEPVAPVEDENAPIDPKDFKLDELQAKAAELDLDTSGTKAEIADRINAHKAEAPEATE